MFIVPRTKIHVDICIIHVWWVYHYVCNVETISGYYVISKRCCFENCLVWTIMLKKFRWTYYRLHYFKTFVPYSGEFFVSVVKQQWNLHTWSEVGKKKLSVTCGRIAEDLFSETLIPFQTIESDDNTRKTNVLLFFQQKW